MNCAKSNAADNSKDLGLECVLLNAKGGKTTANPAHLVSTDELVSSTKGGAVFSPKAFVQLWGCDLAKEMAPILAEEANIHVRACTGKTDFSNVLAGGFPAPSDGGAWQDFE